MKKSILLILFSASLSLLIALSGCSDKKEEQTKTSLYPKVRDQMLQEQKERDKRSVGSVTTLDDKTRKKLLAKAEACDRQYARCIGKCEDSACDERCTKTLEACEKGLPEDLKTIK